MKTVMKKMFSLLLVAVMLVSAVPTAFADEAVTCPEHTTSKVTQNSMYDKAPTCEEDGAYGYYCHDGAHSFKHGVIPATDHDWDEGVITKEATCTSKGTVTYTCKNDPSHTYEEKTPAALHSYADATCTTPKKCTVCNKEEGAELGHDWKAATCTVAKTCETCGATEGEALGHQLGSDKVCTVCKECDHCKETINAASDHLDSCPNSTNYKTLCTKCNTEYITVNGHPDCEVCDGCHTTANCPYCSVCWPEDKVTTHKASDHCEKCESLDHDTADHCTKCGKTDGTHKSDCPNYVSSGSSKVKVYVNLYTGDVKTSTKQLVVYKEDRNTTISDSIIEHKDLIIAELEDQYPNYTWSGNVYDSENEDGENMNSKVGKGITVHINAHSKENLVYLYIHNSRSYDRIGIVRLHGKKVGETVTEAEVRKAVKDYYSFSHLSMYDTEKWDDYVDGKTVKPDGTLTVGSSHYVIDVKISGSVKSSSSYTADSTNPKTGDDIFVPMAVLGLSASALAVLFYLNKKRAY